jgi:hypothetical protein
MIKIDLDIGDEILGGKFKNMKMTVKGFDEDDLGQPIIITDKNKKLKLLSFRIKKLMPKMNKRILEIQSKLIKLNADEKLLNRVDKIDQFLMSKNDKDWENLIEENFGNTGFYGGDENEFGEYNDEQDTVSNFEDYANNGGDLDYLIRMGMDIIRKKYPEAIKKKNK